MSLDQFRDETLDETVLVAVLGERVVGFVAIWEPESFIHHLYVQPDSQRSGVGSALLLEACSVVTQGRVWLKTQDRNQIARDFYSARGFRSTEDSGEDEYGRWIAMELLLHR